jgi:hypothetical protein
MIIYEYWVGIGVGKGVWASYTSINSLAKGVNVKEVMVSSIVIKNDLGGLTGA